LPYGHGVYVLLEALGADAEADAARLEQALAEALRGGLISDAVIAKSEAERRALWLIREDVFQTRRYGATLDFDVSLAQRNVESYIRPVRAAVAEAHPPSHVF